MAIHFQFIDFVYPEGFNTFKKNHMVRFYSSLKKDDFFNDGAMISMAIENLINKWIKIVCGFLCFRACV